ncbi:alpha/beta hydrolase [Anabaena sp. UHCC 0204]|nr:alpha/beta hydrolase [Anabaena sp. UHCC 0204]
MSFPITNHQSPITNHQLPITNYQLTNVPTSRNELQHTHRHLLFL